MIPASLLETNRRLRQVPLVCAISICLDGYKSAYLDVAIQRGMVPNLDFTWQYGTSHTAHSFIPLYTNSNPNKSDVVCWVQAPNKTDMAFCLTCGIAQMRNELRESLVTAYRT